MSQPAAAIYENGTLILEKPLAVSEGERVEIIVLSPNSEKQTKTPRELLAEIAALPLEGNGEKFSNREHDRILYGKESER